ncbi:hypothetical protein K440DRAFT_172233 [Wilcoxina mikolae CBS 423.85]|nr:hypothetical protein K440DRAFT_172233 [Wilcoxina mikolae CBS 423.85]
MAKRTKKRKVLPANMPNVSLGLGRYGGTIRVMVLDNVPLSSNVLAMDKVARNMLVRGSAWSGKEGLRGELVVCGSGACPWRVIGIIANIDNIYADVLIGHPCMLFFVCVWVAADSSRVPGREEVRCIRNRSCAHEGSFWYLSKAQ